MIIDETVKIKWNGRNKKRLQNLGYIYTKINDEVEVKIQDLSSGSNALIHIQCDYCGEIFTRTYDTHMRLCKKDVVHKDCCGNAECTSLKAEETIMAKYNVSHVRELDWVNDKISKTNIQKYGHENPFGSDIIKNKLKETNLKKYGYTSYSKTQKFKDNNSKKMKEFFKQHPEKILAKEASPHWIGDADYKRISSSQPSLNAHHIENFASNPLKRLDVNNGITLCENCHNKFHSIYGKKNNNLNQIQEFINNFNLDEKIC